MKAKIFIFMVALLLVTNVMAVESLGTFKQSESITLRQTCGNCTYVNITSVVDPNSDTCLAETALTKAKTEYTFVSTNCSSSVGTYTVNGFGDVDGIDTVFSYEYDVTVSGFGLSVGDSVLYSLFSVILFGVISTLIFLVFVIPGNEKDSGGFDTKVIRLKYLRVVLIGLTYALVIVLFNFLNGLALNFSSLSLFAGTLGFLFDIMLRFSWPFTIILIAWVIVMLVHDTNVEKRIKSMESTLDGIVNNA